VCSKVSVATVFIRFGNMRKANKILTYDSLKLWAAVVHRLIAPTVEPAVPAALVAPVATTMATSLSA